MDGVHEYRAGWRQGVYEWWKDREVVSFTLTLSDEALAFVPTADSLGRRVDAAMARQAVTGLVVVEEARGDRRYHAHGIAERSGLDEFLARWKSDYGFVLQKPVTDLMGWVMYMFKAFGPESVWTWRLGGQLCIEQGLGMGGATGVVSPGRQGTVTVPTVGTGRTGVREAPTGGTGDGKRFRVREIL